MAYSTAQIRNVALAGHSGAGKTTLFEALLQAGGAIQAAGSVERGSTVSDFDPMEKARGHSLNTAVASTDHAGIHVNLVDTPGFADFRGPTLSAFSAVETVCVVVNAAHGIEYGTRRMMDTAKARGLCRVLVVNRIDAEPGKLAALVAQLREEFGPECLPINLPAKNASTVVDCFFAPEGESDVEDVGAAHQRIIDQVVEINETVMGRYLEDGEAGLSGQDLHDAFEQCLREGHLVPICFVSARTGAGVKELLDLAEKLFPSPLEGNPPAFVRGTGAEAQPITLAPQDPKAHVIADVFKIANDPFVGKLSVFRVFQGTIRKDTQLLVDDGKKPFKVGHLFKLKGKEHVEVELAIAGDIAAVAKVEEIHFDAVLHDSHDEDHIHLKPLEFPKPMFGLAVEAATRGQEQKLSTALHRLAEEDPGFVVEHNPELNETVMRGLGELHLRVMIERMKERYGVEVKTRQPRIAYRETIGGKAEGHYRHKKQTGGAGQFGEVFLQDRAARARRRLRVRGRDQGRHHPRPVPAGDREGRAPGAARRRDRRLPAAGRARNRLRRQVPSRGFQGGRLRRRWQEGLPRRDRQGAAAGAGTDRGAVGVGARSAHGRHHRRPGLQARAHQRHRLGARRRDPDQGAGAAVRAEGLRRGA